MHSFSSSLFSVSLWMRQAALAIQGGPRRVFQAQPRSHVGPIHHMCHWEMLPSPPLKEDLSQLGYGPRGRVSWAQQPSCVGLRGYMYFSKIFSSPLGSGETELRWSGRPVEGQSQVGSGHWEHLPKKSKLYSQAESIPGHPGVLWMVPWAHQATPRLLGVKGETHAR